MSKVGEASSDARIRPAVPADFARILALNEESVHFLAPMDLERLKLLHGESAYHRVFDAGNGAEAFLIALREGAAYDSVNYRWFAGRYERFLYIDRIVVSGSLRGKGVGTLLYGDLFAYAAGTGISPVTCEFDVDPPNEPSRRFHSSFGFSEVGTQRAGAQGKLVSLQAARLDAAPTA
jgi:predicted GNAT superfamily acetyltransferase